MNDQANIKPYVIGLDLGGTNSVFGIVDARGDKVIMKKIMNLTKIIRILKTLKIKTKEIII